MGVTPQQNPLLGQEGLCLTVAMSFSEWRCCPDEEVVSGYQMCCEPNPRELGWSVVGALTEEWQA